MYFENQLDTRMGSIYCWLFIMILLCNGITSVSAVAQDRPPNIVIIITDDQGWGDLSLHGNRNIYTPHLDRLASRGAQFTDFYVQPVCSPTRAELLTGRYSARCGVYSTSRGGERLDLNEVTLAEYFKSAGYATAAFGKWHNGMQYPYHPNGRGFDEFYGFCSGHWGNYFSPMLEHNGKIVQGNGYLPDDLTDRALQFMEQQRDAPFLVYVAYNTPHAPMQVPDVWWEQVINRPIHLRHSLRENIPFTRAAIAMCENIDSNVGRMMHKLSDLDLEEETIVIYLHDNGPNSYRWNGGMKGRKGSTDEGGVRSPLFIRWPAQIEAGTQVHQLAAVVDILPTLTDLTQIPTGLSGAQPWDGMTLAKYLTQSDATTIDRLVFNHWRQRVSVRNTQYRLDHEGRLFDLKNDRAQKTNIADTQPVVFNYLSKAKKQFEKEVVSELPAQDPRPFLLGHPNYSTTQIPARDGRAFGNIRRSDNSPNCSFFTNWINTSDSMTWDVEVMQNGLYGVTLYYTCPDSDVGSNIMLSHGSHHIKAQVTEGWDPPLRGENEDRVPRTNSYIKDFRPMPLGQMQLTKGRDLLILKATAIPGKQVMDMRLLMFERLD